MKRALLVILIAALPVVNAFAIQARRSSGLYTQPDGTRFTVTISGDEWFHMVKTSGGEAIIKDNDGWWCYALFDADGLKYSSGYRVGSPAPAHILAGSRNFPVEKMRERAAEKRARFAARIQKRMQNRANAVTRAGTQEIKVALILAQTPDQKFSVGREQFENMMNQQGYSYNGATGSASDYFHKQLGSAYSVNFVVSSIVTLPKNMSYYGQNDSNGDDLRPGELVADACRLAHDNSESPVNFSEFDCDSDGYVDNVFVMVAGGDEADYAEGEGEDYIWSHSWSIVEQGINLTLDGVKIDAYAISTELANVSTGYKYQGQLTGIGTMCHEFSHLLGLMDLYDTDYEGSGGTGKGMLMTTALMDGGNGNNKYNTPPNYNAIDLHTLGLGTCETVSNGTYTLQPIGKEQKYYKIETDSEDEFYLLECRDNDGWDKYIEGKGLAIYHIDQSGRKTGRSDYFKRDLTAAERWEANEINCRPDHQCAEFITASPRSTSAETAFFPYKNNNAFSADTTPGMSWWSGNTPNCGISGIKLNADGSATFTVSATMSFKEEEVFQDAIILCWKGGDTECSISLDGKQLATGIKADSEGLCHYLIEGLSPNTQYSIVISDGGSSFTKQIKTKAYYDNSRPFIYLVGTDRDGDGRFNPGAQIPLRVYNAPLAQKVRWTFNGKEIKAGEDCRYSITGKGTLKAYVTYEDGSTDILVKEITMK